MAIRYQAFTCFVAKSSTAFDCMHTADGLRLTKIGDRHNLPGPAWRMGAPYLPNGIGMTSRLFIIDQSLDQPGGHHFEYTRLLARAAQAAGIVPVIATHKRLDKESLRQLERYGDVRPVYRNTVYITCSYLAGLAELNRKAGVEFPSDDLRGWRNWLARRRLSAFESRRKKHIGQFAEDCQSLFAESIFEESDQVFFTTVSEVDMLGLAAFLANNPRTLLPSWHCQFHFSIFSGRPGEFEQQSQREAMVHHSLRAALARIPYHDLRFYTTSRELQDQYRRFPHVTFDELPYPIEPALFENQRPSPPAERPLRLTVAGGVRREKAQKFYLGGLIRSLWATHLESDAVELHIQSSDRSVFSRKAVFGKSSECPAPASDEAYASRVHFHQHPLPDSEYFELVGNSDIGMLFYDSRKYYSRRAGILSEFLASGKPVIVPAGCWLARQIREPAFRHIESVLNQASRTEVLGIRDTDWEPDNAPLGSNVICFDRLQNPWRCRATPQQCGNPDGMIVRFRWQWPRDREEFALINARFFDKNGDVLCENREICGARDDKEACLVFFRCPKGTAVAEVAFRTAYTDASISLTGLQFHFLGFENGSSIPLSQVGLIVADPCDLPSAVEEIVTHYRHYLETAVRFGREWALGHDPECTLNALLDRQERFRQVA
jgi:hypothetical protein